MPTAHQPGPAQLIAQWLSHDRRVLLLGKSGAGKTTLITSLMRELQSLGRTSVCLSCDPGLPGFGIPGAVSLGQLEGNVWKILAVAPLCTLDAGRFRLPLLVAAQQLLKQLQQLLPDSGFTLFVDTPGLTRGIAVSELIPALVDSADIDLSLLLENDVPADNPDTGMTTHLPRPVRLPIAAEAYPFTRSERRQKRSTLWNAYMANARPWSTPLRRLLLTGTPPPTSAAMAWQGRQVALYNGQHLKTLGEVVQVTSDELHLRVAANPGKPDRLLVRDAVHRNGQLRTAPKPRQPDAIPATRDDAGVVEVRAELGALTSVARDPQVAVRVGNVVASLVNGVMGDPLLQVRMLHRRRSLLFDVGDTGRMPLRAAHQVSDLFLTHAHADHIGGFIWLVRSRIGHFPPCRIVGPPGLLQQVEGMMNGILWDRVEDRGPCFEVNEWHGDHLKRRRLTAGCSAAEHLPDQPVVDGIVLREPGFVVRAVELDHGIPVLAYAYEPHNQIRVRKDKLEELGLTPGPWLQQLKQSYFQGHWEKTIPLSDGRSPTVDELTKALLLIEPGSKLAYATDFGDTPDNVSRLSALARHAHTLFCESSFLTSDRDQACRTHHLTTEACARIANQSQVQQLVAFHFSHRYEQRREEVYRELQQFTSRVVIPTALEAE